MSKHPEHPCLCASFEGCVWQALAEGWYCRRSMIPVAPNRRVTMSWTVKSKVAGETQTTWGATDARSMRFTNLKPTDELEVVCQLIPAEESVEEKRSTLEPASYAGFAVGDRVRYVPYHAHGDITHKDCEDGVISSINSVGTIFVRFGNRSTAQGCQADQLVSCSSFSLLACVLCHDSLSGLY